MKREETFLGVVRGINGIRLYVIVPARIDLVPRVIQGKEYRVGQVGSFVCIPLESMDLFGIISAVTGPESPSVSNILPTNSPNRWLEVQLIGESDRKGKFWRGVSIFPSLDDEVHIAVVEDMALLYGTPDSSHMKIGMHASIPDLPAIVDIDKLVTRHTAVIGSTGSGKSNTVALLLKTLIQEGYPNTQIVVIDPHGEYGAALKEGARVFSIHDEENPLYLPFWALAYDELAWFLVDRDSATESNQDKILRLKIYEEKRRNHALMNKEDSEEAVHLTADSPVPFDLKKVWFDIYQDENATYWEKENYHNVAYKIGLTGGAIKGNVEHLIPPEYQPASTGPNPPFPSTKKAGMGVYLNKIFMRLHDSNFNFLLRPGEYDGVKKDLSDLIESWIGHPKPITVINLEGVPFEVMDLVIGVLTKILFQAMFWGRNLPGIGRQRPLLIVFEEAHAYLSKAKDMRFISGYALTSARRVLKEGRKYGIGSIVVSQRPSELDANILSETGTYFALRLSNSEDCALIHSLLPDGLSGLTDLLPGLRTGEAIIAGEAVNIPSWVALSMVEPRPNSADSEPAKQWMTQRVAKSPYQAVVNGWRSQNVPKQT